MSQIKKQSYSRHFYTCNQPRLGFCDFWTTLMMRSPGSCPGSSQNGQAYDGLWSVAVRLLVLLAVVCPDLKHLERRRQRRPENRFPQNKRISQYACYSTMSSQPGSIWMSNPVFSCMTKRTLHIWLWVETLVPREHPKASWRECDSGR